MPRKAASRPAAGRRRLLLALFALPLMGAVLLLARPAGRWLSLGPEAGRLRWVATPAAPTVEPPLAPGWVRRLRQAGVPWPADLPLEPPGASFGPPPAGHRAAWFLVESAADSPDLWHLDKDSARLLDASGREHPWEGATGSVLLSREERRQLLYLTVPGALPGTGARLRFRLARFDGSVTEEVTSRF